MFSPGFYTPRPPPFVREFGPTGVIGGPDFGSFLLPQCNQVQIVCIGAGAGGGGGGGNSAGTTRTGGAGGGAGAITVLQIPRIYLPDRLYYLIGCGGAGTVGTTGGATASTGQGGRRTRVCIYPDATVDNVICVSGAADAAGGTGGGNGGAPAGGAGGTIATDALMPRGAYFGTVRYIAGAAGQTGSDTTADVPLVTPSTSTAWLLGGCAGGAISSGNTQRAAGSYAAIANTPMIAIPVAPIPSGDGSGGFVIFGKLLTYGGTGGACGSGAANGGNGGSCAAAPGAGGGGGGAGTTTGGRGGDGGPGRVIVTCW